MGVCVSVCVVWDYPGRPVPEETLTHSSASEVTTLWRYTNLFMIIIIIIIITPILVTGHPLSTPPFTTIHSVLFVHFTC